MSRAKKIVILTSVHRPFDTRIYEREAVTLANGGYQVILIATDTPEHQTVDGIHVVGVPKPKWRLGRVFNWFYFLKISLSQKADIYHFHDPDLLPVGLILRWLTGKAVIYDRHENYHEDILAKEWIPKPFRNVISIFFKGLEKLIADRLSAVIVVVDEHLANFSNALTIYNFPALEDFVEMPDTVRDPYKLIYLGSLGRTYGSWTLVKMLTLVKNESIHLDWFGYYREDGAEADIQQLLCQYKLHNRFRLLGHIPYHQVKNHLTKAAIGLIMLQDIPAYSTALPRKMFEYMACGLPVIASNLKAIGKVVTDANCGLLVEPDNPEALAEAVTYLINHPEEAHVMGENGRQAVIEKYNWTGEARKLLNLYQALLGEA